MDQYLCSAFTTLCGVYQLVCYLKLCQRKSERNKNKKTKNNDTKTVDLAYRCALTYTEFHLTVCGICQCRTLVSLLEIPTSALNQLLFQLHCGERCVAKSVLSKGTLKAFNHQRHKICHQICSNFSCVKKICQTYLFIMQLITLMA